MQSFVGRGLPNSLPTNQDWDLSQKANRTQGPKLLYRSGCPLGPSLTAYIDSAVIPARVRACISLHVQFPFHCATVLAHIRGYNKHICSYCDHLLPASQLQHAVKHIWLAKESRYEISSTAAPSKCLLLEDHFFPNTTSYKATLWHELFLFLSALIPPNIIFSAWYFEWKSHSDYWDKSRAANATSDLQYSLVSFVSVSSHTWNASASYLCKGYPFV